MGLGDERRRKITVPYGRGTSEKCLPHSQAPKWTQLLFPNPEQGRKQSLSLNKPSVTEACQPLIVSFRGLCLKQCTKQREKPCLLSFAGIPVPLCVQMGYITLYKAHSESREYASLHAQYDKISGFHSSPSLGMGEPCI